MCIEGRELLIDLHFRINHTQGIVAKEVHSGTLSLLAPDFNNDFLEFELMSYWADAFEMAYSACNMAINLRRGECYSLSQ